MDPASGIDRHRPLVESELKQVVSDRNLPLYSMMEYHLGWSTDDLTPPISRERVLGALCISACEALGGEPERAAPMAAAIELVQNFCEIHDDIQSGKISRDDRDAVWWKWGPAQAINAGDGMHALARLALFRLMDREVNAEDVFEAVRLLDEASLATCEGRFMDLEAQERLDMSSEAYLKMAEAKSGSLFSCAMEYGALAANASVHAREQFASAGRHLGVAVQIADDVRQLNSGLDESSPPSDDVMNKKKLYPVVKAFEVASPSERRRLGDYYFKRVLEPLDVRSLSSVIVDLGVMDAARSEIASHLEEVERLVLSATDSEDAGRTLVEDSKLAVAGY